MAAKLQHPFLLCNDINPKSLIDISEDTDENSIVITSKHRIQIFSLSDRRQRNSYLTNSWHPFTSRALRDCNSNKIICVTNKSYICKWDLEETNIENAKKISFMSSINMLVLHKKEIYVVYDCGFVETLTDALTLRKENKFQVLQEKERIVNFAIIEDQCIRKYIMFIEKEGSDHWLCIFDGKQLNPYCLSIHLPNYHLIGSCLLSSGKLLTAWSDGNLYSMNTLDPGSSPNPGTLQGNLSFFTSTKKIKLIELCQTHIVLQGMDSNEDGGLVVLWDLKFGVNVSSKPMKMYRDPPLAWNVHSGIVLVDGGVLAYIPVVLNPSTVASMFGSRIGDAGSCDECIGWKQPTQKSLVVNGEVAVSEQAHQTIFTNKSAELCQVIRLVAPGATSEATVVHLVICHLIGKGKITLILESLKTFSFIPEKSLISILKYLLNIPNEDYKCSEEDKSTSIKKRKSIAKKLLASETKQDDFSQLNLSLVKNDEDEKERRIQAALTPVFCREKEKAINRVLKQPFSEKQLSISIRQLDFNSSWCLVQHLHHILASGKAKIVEDPEEEFPSINTAGQWLSLVLDCNYHHLVMTSELDIHRRMLDCLQDVSNLLAFLESSNSIDPLVERVMHSQEMPTTQAHAPYSIERILLS